MIDRPDNTVFKYLYCNSFKWNYPMDHEVRGGHPKPGGVYRAWYNTETKSYRLLSNPGQAIYIQSLVETDDFPHGFVCDLEEITQQNILKFKDISEDSLNDLLTWLEYNNADLKERLGFTSPSPQQFLAIIREPLNNPLQGFIESGEELFNLHPVAFEKIWQLIDIVLDKMYEEDISFELKHSTEGKGINISDTFKSLEKYIGKDRRTNENPDDLYEAMTCIITELIRREYNNLDNEKTI